MRLVADCGRCRALCCVAPAFARSADFAIDKAAGQACPNLRGSACGIHDQLLDRGFPGCVAYDCFGAGQQVVQVVFGGGPRTPRMLRVYELARQLHELLWYAADALGRPAAAPVHAALATARDAIEPLLTDADTLEATDPAAHRRAVAPLLRRASALTRAAERPGSPTRAAATGRDRAGPSRTRVTTGDRADRDPAPQDRADRDPSAQDRAGRDLAAQDLAGRDFAGADLRAADLSTSSLLRADLRRADLRTADLLGADLRGADLRGADLTGALYLTRSQVGAARGDTATRLPPALTPPAHWR